jgi:predicted secreted Zn-dependent protease
MKRRNLFSVGALAAALLSLSFSVSADDSITRQCFNPWSSLQNTQPDFVKSALGEFRNYDFVNFTSIAGLEIGVNDRNAAKQKVSGSVTTQYFDVDGKNPIELIESLKAKIPHAARVVAGTPSTTDRVDAVTGAIIGWNFWLDAVSANSNVCTIRWVDVSAHITYWFPRWKTSYQATAEVQADWQEYTKALAYHELGHAAQAYKVADEALQQMISLKNKPTSCDALRDELNKIGNQAIQNQISNDSEYDRLTLSGATQGARFERRDLCFAPGKPALYKKANK